jgi:hypothetical protein
MKVQVVFIVLLLSPSLMARSSHGAIHRLDPSYSAALAAANRFLHAWQTQDHEIGIMMLTDAARQRTTREKLQDFFSPAQSAAFEIQHGKRVNGGEYVFPVVLFGASEESVRPRFSRLVMMRLDKGDWVVDRLP